LTNYRIVTNGRGGYRVQRKRRLLWVSWWENATWGVQPSLAAAEHYLEWSKFIDECERRERGPWRPVVNPCPDAETRRVMAMQALLHAALHLIRNDQTMDADTDAAYEIIMAAHDRISAGTS
jgi:hypothetical protein